MGAGGRAPVGRPKERRAEEGEGLAGPALALGLAPLRRSCAERPRSLPPSLPPGAPLGWGRGGLAGARPAGGESAAGCGSAPSLLPPRAPMSSPARPSREVGARARGEVNLSRELPLLLRGRNGAGFCGAFRDPARPFCRCGKRGSPARGLPSCRSSGPHRRGRSSLPSSRDGERGWKRGSSPAVRVQGRAGL